MQGFFCDEEVMYYGDGVKSPEWIDMWIKGCHEDYSTNRGTGLWAVVRKSTGDVIGYCGLTNFPDIDGQPEIEIGFRLKNQHWGNGYATEAAIVVRDLAFNQFGITRLVGMVDPRNAASIRVVDKLRMKFEKKVMFKNNTYCDNLYVINK